MIQIIRYFCDICDKECLVQDGLGTFAGFVIKLDKELKQQRVGFEGHYCSTCSEEIFKFISELKNAQHPSPPGVGEQKK